MCDFLWWRLLLLAAVVTLVEAQECKAKDVPPFRDLGMFHCQAQDSGCDEFANMSESYKLCKDFDKDKPCGVPKPEIVVVRDKATATAKATAYCHPGQRWHTWANPSDSSTLKFTNDTKSEIQCSEGKWGPWSGGCYSYDLALLQPAWQMNNYSTDTGPERAVDGRNGTISWIKNMAPKDKYGWWIVKLAREAQKAWALFIFDRSKFNISGTHGYVNYAVRSLQNYSGSGEPQCNGTFSCRCGEIITTLDGAGYGYRAYLANRTCYRKTKYVAIVHLGNSRLILSAVHVWGFACLDGYEGDKCETKTKDECKSNPCQNGGTCINGTDRYHCECSQYSKGERCQTDIDECASDPCPNQATCINGKMGYDCQCPEDFTGNQCESNINMCSSSPCGDNGHCTKLTDGYSCQCDVGFTGDNCKNFMDMDGCEDACQNAGLCIDVENGFTCQCLPGFAGKYCESKVNGTGENGPEKFSGLVIGVSVGSVLFLLAVIAVPLVVLFVCRRIGKKPKEEIALGLSDADIVEGEEHIHQ